MRKWQYFSLFLIILAATWVLSTWNEVAALGAIILLVSMAVVTVLALYETAKANKKEDDISHVGSMSAFASGWIWIAWIVYGMLLKNAPLFDIAANIYAAILFAFVILSYSEYVSQTLVHWMFVTFIFILLVPNEDALYPLIPQGILMAKVAIFYILYTLCDFADSFVKETPRSSDWTMKNNSTLLCMPYPVFISTPEQLCRAQLKIIRSAWVLFVPRYMLFPSLVQLILSVVTIVKIIKNEIQKPVERKIPKQRETAPPVPVVVEEEEEVPRTVQVRRSKKRPTPAYLTQPVQPVSQPIGPPATKPSPQITLYYPQSSKPSATPITRFGGSVKGLVLRE